jgi:ABC-type antimicrobial peptide transport system permease subunit
MIVGFLIVIEALFHYTAIFAYLQSANLLNTLMTPILISLVPVVITFVIFLLVQVLAIVLANRKILKVRPIIALKKPGE